MGSFWASQGMIIVIRRYNTRFLAYNRCSVRGSCCCLVTQFLSCSFATQWTVAHQASLSMGFPRQEHWSGLPFPSPGDLPDPGIEPASSELAGRFFTTKPPGKWRNQPRHHMPQKFSTIVHFVWQLTLALPWESRRQRSLAGYSPELQSRTQLKQLSTQHICSGHVIHMLTLSVHDLQILFGTRDTKVILGQSCQLLHPGRWGPQSYPFPSMPWWSHWISCFFGSGN